MGDGGLRPDKSTRPYLKNKAKKGWGCGSSGSEFRPQYCQKSKKIKNKKQKAIASCPPQVRRAQRKAKGSLTRNKISSCDRS
jgi:hypothetical protein